MGESIAVNGCCLTVVACDQGRLEFQAGPETLARTNLGELRAGQRGEPRTRRCKFGDRLGGHLVTGHIDGVGTVDERRRRSRVVHVLVSRAGATDAADGRQRLGRRRWREPDAWSTVEDDRFSVQLIPHTLAVTTLGRRPSRRPC